MSRKQRQNVSVGRQGGSRVSMMGNQGDLSIFFLISVVAKVSFKELKAFLRNYF